MSDEQEQDSSPPMPIEQQTIMFYGKVRHEAVYEIAHRG